MLEKEIEKKVCDYAKEKGMLVYKFTSPARAAVPDRLFIVPLKMDNAVLRNAKAFFIEFKQSGKKATVPQQREINRLLNAGIRAYLVDDVEMGKKIIDHENR